MDMWFGGDTHFALKPKAWDIAPFASRLQKKWLECELEPVRCQAALEELVAQFELPPAWFAPREIGRGGRPATRALLFEAFAPPAAWVWEFASRRADVGFGVDVAREDAALVAALVRGSAAATDAASFRARASAVADDDVVDALVRALTRDAPFGRWPAVQAPGIYRREHASLVLRSRTTTLVVDPQPMQYGWTTQHGRYPAERGLGRVDGVLVTHLHEDHWHLPSVLSVVADASTPVVVPHVPSVNLLCPEDPAVSLAVAGQRSLAPAWYSSVRIGDFEIEILPFFGEQPTRDAPGVESGLRNWGNVYRVACPDFSAMILVDSGADPAGDVLEVLGRSVAARGPVDAVLSCCLEFPEAINDGLPQYVLTLPFDRLRSIHDGQRAGRVLATTMGPRDAASACQAAGASLFLPYAHGFRGLGCDPLGGAGEGEAMARVEHELSAQGSAARVARWSPGDACLFERGVSSIAHWTS